MQIQNQQNSQAKLDYENPSTDELILDETIQNQFVEWVGQYYDKGLRSCTISSKHLMRTRKLQQRCPNMKRKNTVNQIIADGQHVPDTNGNGNDTILAVLMMGSSI